MSERGNPHSSLVAAIVEQFAQHAATMLAFGEPLDSYTKEELMALVCWQQQQIEQATQEHERRLRMISNL